MSIWLIIFSVFITLQTLKGQSEVTINTQLGDIKGVSINEGDITTFKAIQYVENQPVDTYRFKQSQMKTSSYIGTYDATNFGPICPPRASSNPPEPQSESCLLLNIWTNSIQPNANLPVLVYIHGGGFSGESGISQNNGYNTPPFVYGTEDIVYVSFNYRLGGLGFLPLKEIKKESRGVTNGGLNGINDQIVALEWIQEYISDFGGNPNQVTIWGISAGSQSICHLLVSPNAKGLFKNAILGSGACIADPTNQQMSEQEGFKYAVKALQENGINDISLDNLRALPYEDLRDAYIAKRTIDGDTFGKELSIDAKVKLTIDGYVIKENSFKTFNRKNLRINAENVIIGFTNFEALLHQPFFATNMIFPRDITQYNAYIDAYISDDDEIDDLNNIYYPLEEYVSYLPVPPPPFTQLPPWPEISQISNKWSTMSGDCCTSCPSLKTADVFQKTLNHIHEPKGSKNGPKRNTKGNTKIYVYNIRGGDPFYYYHGSDVILLFYNPLPPPNGSPFGFPFLHFLFGNTYDPALATLMQSSWINFAVNDDPGNNWSEFGTNSNVMLFENGNSRVVSDYINTFRNGACNYWIDEIGWDIMGDLCENSLGAVPVPNSAASINFKPNLPMNNEPSSSTWTISISSSWFWMIVLLLIMILSLNICVLVICNDMKSKRKRGYISAKNIDSEYYDSENNPLNA